MKMKQTFLNQFNIGWEFELTVSYKIQKTEIDEIPEDIWLSYGHLMDARLADMSLESAYDAFMATLIEKFPARDWHNICLDREDYTVKADRNHYPLEVATIALPGYEAMEVFHEICEVLRMKMFKINHSCGIHLNVSFKENMPDTFPMVLALSEKLDLFEINESFGRMKNEHCAPNNSTELELGDLKDMLLTAMLHNKPILTDNVDTVTVQDCLDIIDSLKTQSDLVHFRELARHALIEKVEYQWEDNRPALAPRKNGKDQYIEFRSMGGKDYPHKVQLLEDTIEMVLTEMSHYRKMLNKHNS